MTKKFAVATVTNDELSLEIVQATDAEAALEKAPHLAGWLLDWNSDEYDTFEDFLIDNDVPVEVREIK
jgi:hypothetical protein